ncbi:cytochrome c oxidase assembly protein [Nocardioides terrisoli]|uniref:cytochrome c oxidase assembly protein n=1 Tax=Nocardioides terrisoli TaxID=3388267 RepID=UPI00287BA73D|nr:cytochrome c oxidase assembly protein [Nocardioides marmorisolisilvae]
MPECLAAMPLLTLLHADVPGLPRFGPSVIWTQWGLDPWLFVGIVWIAGAYVYGVRVIHRRGDRWPVGRTLSFVLGGMGLLYFATSSGLAAYDDTLLSVHMVQHMLLMMPVPLFLALGAPVTLALRTFRPRPRRWLLWLLHSPLARVLTFAPLTLAVYVLSPWVLYFTGWYDASLRSDLVHELMHVHLVLAGAVFFWPLVGVDPVPGRLAHPFRLLLVFLTLPFHAFLGVTIMSQSTLIGGDWYPHLHRTMGWLPDPLADQHLAGGILWGSGDLIGLMFFVVLFVQWVRSAKREAEREDRRLDRVERLAGAGR